MTNEIGESEAAERRRITLSEVVFGNGKWFELVTSLLAISSSLFALYTGLFGEEVELIQRGVHFGFSVALIFLVTGKDSAWWKRVPSHPCGVGIAV